MSIQDLMNIEALDELQTPCLLLDKDRMIANIKKMQTKIDALHVSFRPHVKTNKSHTVTEHILSQMVAPKITVSTLHEARYFFGAGIKDIMYGVGITEQKLLEVADLIRKGADIKIILDDANMAKSVQEAGGELGVVFSTYIELDVDGHRSGVEPADPVLIEIARLLSAGKGTTLAGVMTHAGQSYDCKSTEEIAAMAEQERRRSVQAATNIRSAGMECPEVSVGSSPTATFAEHLDGVTEVRAGVYVFQDLFQAGLGCCKKSDIALSVLATVNAHKRNKNIAIVDAGWMAMSRDRGTASQAVDQGYGVVADEYGNPIDDLIMVGANQEHGLIGARDGGPVNFDKLPLGSRVRILPNHACATAAQYDHYNVLENNSFAERWQRIRGW